MSETTFRWLDLGAHRLRATEVRTNNARSILVISGDVGTNVDALARSGITLNKQIGRYLAAYQPELLQRLADNFPLARWVREGDRLEDGSVVSRDMFIRGAESASPQGPSNAPTTGPATVEVSEAEILNTRVFLGKNRSDTPVYALPDGRRFIANTGGRAVFEGTPQASGLMPSAFLDGSKSLEQRVLSLSGFVEGMVAGGVFRFDSLQRIAAIVFRIPEDEIKPQDPQVLQTFEAFNTAISRRIANDMEAPLSDVFITASRLSENFSVLREMEEFHSVVSNGYVPPAVGILLNRISGTEAELSGANIAVSGLTFGAFFTRLPKTAHIAVSAPTPYDVAVIRSMGRQAHLEDITVDTGSVAPTDYCISVPQKDILEAPRTIRNRAPGGNDLVLMRADLVSFIEDIERRPADGRTVSVLRFSDAEEDLLEQFRSWVGSHYAVDGALLMPSSLVAGRVGQDNLLIYSVGMRRPNPVSVLTSEDGTVHPAMRMKRDVESFHAGWAWATTLTAARAKITNHHEALGPDVDGGAGNISDAEANVFQKPYQSISSIGSPRTMVPANMQRSVRIAQKNFIQEFGDPDVFVCNNLGLTREQLKAGWSPEQVDAIALAIASDLRGRGAFLLSDETGIGKGRTLLGICLYALMQGKRAIYFTESPDSFTDLYDEMVQMGIQEQFSIMTMGAASASVIKNAETDEIILPGTPGALQQALAVLRHWPDGTSVRAYTLTPEEVIRLRSMTSVDPDVDDVVKNIRGNIFFMLGDGDLPGVINEDAVTKGDRWNPHSNFIMTTFSQYNRPAEQAHGRRRDKNFVPHDKSAWMQQMCDGNTLAILDESHNVASNVSNMSRNFDKIIGTSWFVGYSSATWAKMAKNMNIYRRVLPPGMNVTSLGETLQKGGETLQETLSSMLAQDGVLLRREHDLSNCEFRSYEDPDADERNVAIINSVAPVLSRMSVLSGDISATLIKTNDERVNDLERDLAERNIALSADSFARAAEKVVVTSMPFGGALARIGTLLDLAMKVDTATNLAIKALKEGQSPLILLDSTANTMLDEIFEASREKGEPGRAPDFRDALIRTLNRLMVGRDRGKDVDLAMHDPHLEMVDLLAAKVAAAMPADLERIASDYPELPYTLDGRSEARRAAIADTDAMLNAYLATLPEYARGDVTDTATMVQSIIRGAMTEMWDEGEGPEARQNNAMLEMAHETLQNIARDVSTDPVEAAKKFLHFERLMPINPARVVKALRSSIEKLPYLPISPFDYIRDGLNDAGYTFDEITGRTRQIVGGRNGVVQAKPRSNKNVVKDAFNRGDLDAIGFNRRGATAAGYHAGRRFRNQKQRALIVLQPPTDPQKFIQALGRVNRFDQVIGPVVYDISNGTPMEMRLKANQNTKLRRMSAATTANRDNAKLAKDIPDLINSVGDRVVTNYLQTRPDLVRRLGLPESTQIDVVMDDNEMTTENARSANQVLTRLSFLLSYEEQVQVLEELESEYKARIAELDARNENPLRTREIRGDVTVVKRVLISGVEGDSVNAFNAPVYADYVQIRDSVEPLRSEDLLHLQEKGILKLSDTSPVDLADTLVRWKNSYLGVFIPAGFHTIEDAAAGGSIVAKSVSDKYDRLVRSLREIYPGKEITLSWNGSTERAIITDLDIPSPNKRMHSTMYDVRFAIPGDTMPHVLNLETLVTDKNYTISDGLMGENPEEVLERFDTATMAAMTVPRVILTGNEWTAMNLAIQHKLGSMTAYTDQNGMRCRGILVSKNADVVRFVPVSVASPKIAAALLISGQASVEGEETVSKLALYCDSSLNPMGPTIRRDKEVEGEPQTFTISLPTTRSPKFKFIYENKEVVGILNRLEEHYRSRDEPVPNFAETRPRVKCRAENLERYIGILADAGVNFHAPAQYRNFVLDCQFEDFKKEARELTGSTREMRDEPQETMTL